jgi:chromosome segregation ATPase
MSKSKDGQVEVNGDKRRSTVNDSRGTGSSDTSDSDGILSADLSSNDYGHNHTKSNSNDNHHNGGNTESQSNLSLGPFTEATSEALHRISVAQKSLKALSNVYKKQLSDIQKVSSTQARCAELEKACTERDAHIRRKTDTIMTLNELIREKGEEAAKKLAGIQKEREALEEEKKNFERQKEMTEKRAKIYEVEQKSKQDKELEKLKTEQDKEYEILKQKLQRDMKKQEDEAKKRLTNLEAENKTLSEQLEAQKVQVEEQNGKLKKAQDDFDDLRRTRDSFIEYNKKLERQLRMMEDEFASNGQTIEF